MHHYNLGTFFEEVLDRHADNVALKYPDSLVSYQELSRLIESAALMLMHEGCEIGDVVAVANTKKPMSYVLMHAALKIGVAYLNIDVESPEIRNSRIIAVSSPSIIFYDDVNYAEKMNSLADTSGLNAKLLDERLCQPVSDEERDALINRMSSVDASTVAYLMFTSGSTGTPKGVAVTHQNLLHFIEWGRGRFSVTEKDNFANLSPMYFDNSVFDFYVGMFSGATLTPVKRELLSEPYDLVSFVNQMNCTIWFSVPSLLIYLVTMRALSKDSLPAINYFIFGGEGYPKVELKKLYDLYSGQATVVNVYGPTECTCICSAHTLSDNDFVDLSGLPTLGKLNQNFDYMIIDEEGVEADTGELCLIGPNVAAGYYNDLDRTTSSFIYITDKQRFMKKMYRTGDIVREVDGMLHFVGRKDNQIKHLGYRIELEEIEHALVRINGVDQAAVVYKRANTSYGKIIAFASMTSDNVDEHNLLKELGNHLPSYMIPSKIVLMDVLPKNANGKVDRKALSTTVDH